MNGYSSMSNTPILSCPDPEQLAALADGGLNGAERQQVVEHLAECGECYEVFVETVRFLEEEPDVAETGGETDGKVLSGPWFGSLRALAVAAALVVAAVGIWSVVGGSGGLPGGSSSELPRVSSLVTRLDLGEEQSTPDELFAAWGWPVMRGEGSRSSGSVDLVPVPEDVAFRLGAISADLEVALQTGRTGASARLSHELERLLGDEVGFSEHLVASYQALRRQIEGGATAEDLARPLADTSALVEERVGVETFRFGAWAEVGRLAAATGDLSYFGRRSVGRTARRLVASDMPSTLLVELEGVVSRLESGVSSGDLPGLERRFAEIVRRGGWPWGTERSQG